MQKLTKEYWNSKSEIIEAAVKGFDPIQQLPKMLKAAYPDFKQLDFGFCHDAAIPEWMSIGWMPMSPTDFDTDEFNKSDIPSRFGLSDVGGRIKYRENTLMAMGKDFRRQLQDARDGHHEDNYRASVMDKKYASPQDPRREEMAKYAESKLESAIIQPKRGPGRPPNQK